MKIKILAFLFISLFKYSILFGQTKVLFLGNSFTYTYDIPGIFQAMATAAGESVFVDERTQAGMAVADEQIIGHINDALSQSKISSQQWDYIVVQDNQGNYVNSVGVIPANAGNANVTLYNQIKANYPCTRIIYFAGWGPEGGVFTGDNTQACINRIYGNMNYLNNNIGNEIVSPIGKAWNTSLSQMPGVDLYYSDNVHPSLEGSYLAAATLFVTIFKRDPSNINYTGGVNSTVAANMRSIAYTTVTNPTIFTETNLSSYTPAISVNGNQLSVANTYSSYQWLQSGNAISGATSSSYTATSNGLYQVEVNNSNGCPMRSLEENITITGIDNFSTKANDIALYLKNKSLYINTNNTSRLLIYNVNGQILLDNILSGQSVVNLSGFSSGMYIVQVINNKDLTLISRKIILP